jgi:hypothetical protein
LSPEMPHVAEAETVGNVEGNMGGAAMRGAVALPGSEATSRRKGTRRNLGDLLPPTAALVVVGRVGKLVRASPIRKAGGVGRLHSTDEASNKADLVGGGECGGKAAGRREGALRRMLRTQCRVRHVPEATRIRTGGAWAAQAPNSGRVRPPTGARCGQAARRDLWGRCRAIGTSTRPTTLG